MVGSWSRKELALIALVTIYCLFLLFTATEKAMETQTIVTAPVIEQLHLAYGEGNETHTSMLLGWSLDSLADDCKVAYWSEDSQLDLFAVKPFAPIWRKQAYRTQLQGLAYDREYHYSVTCRNEKAQVSQQYSFRTNPGLRDNVTLLVLGDWSTSTTGDASNPQHTLTPKPHILLPLLQEHDYSGIWHLGDLAYDLFSNRGTRGDEFMRDIEPLAARQAYMPVVGNHELARLFQDYMQRFALPGPGLYYSLGVGRAQIIAISSEFDYNYMKPLNFPRDQSYYEYMQTRQLAWLRTELEKAQANRHNRPWVIVMAHKPLYCSLNTDSEMIMSVCGLQARVMRNTFEELFLTYQVDVGLFGHVHLYERLLPVRYDQVVGEYNRSESVFINPQAPIYIINGVAGNLENESVVMKVSKTPGPWSATQSESLGYGRLTVVNSTHIHYVQYAFGDTQFDPVDRPLVKRIQDSMWLVRTN